MPSQYNAQYNAFSERHTKEKFPLKICYLLDKFPKVSETFVRDEIEWMASRCHLDRIFALGEEISARTEVSPLVKTKTQVIPVDLPLDDRYVRAKWRLFNLKLFISRLKAYSFSRENYEEFRIALFIARQLFVNPPDLIHVHFAARAAQVARYVGLLTGIPTTFSVHHYDLVLQPPSNFPVLGADAMRMFTISKYNRREMTFVHGLAYDKIEIIHCGVNPDSFRPRLIDDSRTDPDSQLRLLSTGRLVAVKAHRDLINACASLRDAGLNFHLRIIGEGDQRLALTEQIEALDLTGHVELLGAQPSRVVREELTKADLFVMSSLSEGIPVSIMEAMASGLAIVATQVSGIPELVTDGKHGRLTPPENPAELAAAISALAADPYLSIQMGKAGRIRVAEEFNSQLEYERLVNAWRRALNATMLQQMR